MNLSKSEAGQQITRAFDRICVKHIDKSKHSIQKTTDQFDKLFKSISSGKSSRCSLIENTDNEEDVDKKREKLSNICNDLPYSQAFPRRVKQGDKHNDQKQESCELDCYVDDSVGSYCADDEQEVFDSTEVSDSDCDFEDVVSKHPSNIKSLEKGRQKRSHNNEVVASEESGFGEMSLNRSKFIVKDERKSNVNKNRLLGDFVASRRTSDVINQTGHSAESSYEDVRCERQVKDIKCGISDRHNVLRNTPLSKNKPNEISNLRKTQNEVKHEGFNAIDCEPVSNIAKKHTAAKVKKESKNGSNPNSSIQVSARGTTDARDDSEVYNISSDTDGEVEKTNTKLQSFLGCAQLSPRKSSTPFPKMMKKKSIQNQHNKRHSAGEVIQKGFLQSGNGNSATESGGDTYESLNSSAYSQLYSRDPDFFLFHKPRPTSKKTVKPRCPMEVVVSKLRKRKRFQRVSRLCHSNPYRKQQVCIGRWLFAEYARTMDQLSRKRKSTSQKQRRKSVPVKRLRSNSYRAETNSTHKDNAPTSNRSVTKRETNTSNLDKTSNQNIARQNEQINVNRSREPAGNESSKLNTSQILNRSPSLQGTRQQNQSLSSQENVLKNAPKQKVVGVCQPSIQTVRTEEQTLHSTLSSIDRQDGRHRVQRSIRSMFRPHHMGGVWRSIVNEN